VCYFIVTWGDVPRRWQCATSL